MIRSAGLLITTVEKEKKEHPDQNSWFTIGENVSLSEKMVLDTLLPGRFEESGTIRGEYVDIDILKVPFYDHSGALIGTVGIGRM